MLWWLLSTAPPGTRSCPLTHDVCGSRVWHTFRAHLVRCCAQASNLSGTRVVHEVAPPCVCAADKGTPDDWVARREELIRLTGVCGGASCGGGLSGMFLLGLRCAFTAGRHPLNAEPALSTLLERAWPLTPSALLYVRNHGLVPRVDESTHRIELVVQGRRLEFTLEQVRAMPRRSVAVTLACAGNRRKELNMLHPVSGFNWGPAAMGTCVWTGTPLCELLRMHGGVEAPSAEAQHVCFSGVPGEVPIDDGRYGTSIPLAVVLDPTADVLLAWEHNGVPLAPDHGAPLRVIVPGYIGGRSVKWLSRIEVTKEPSRNHFHVHDNRILPPHVTQELADAEDWWHREQFVFNELNVNSVIAEPPHGARVELAPAGGGPQPLELCGYAYSGGGRPVTAVEVTFDGGDSWRLASLASPERGTRYGRHWCAVQWRFPLSDARELLLCDEVACRAVDSAFNTQPAELTWNLKGMGNNAMYRVRVHKEHSDAEGSACVTLRFEAPVEPDGLKGGWMGATPGGCKPPHAPRLPSSVVLEQPATPRQAAEAPPGGGVRRKSSDRRVSRAELKAHSSEVDCWIAIGGKVYAPARFLGQHPGGAFPIVSHAGKDATEEFSIIHSLQAGGLLDDYLVGELEEGPKDEAEHAEPKDETTPWLTVPPSEMAPPRTSERYAAAPLAISPRKRLPFTLRERIVVNHDTRIFRFDLQSPNHILGLPPGRHIFVSANVHDHRVVRPYTPISPGDAKGYCDLLVKVYYPTDGHPGGLMSQYLDGLQPGARVHFRGPLGHIEYAGRGVFYVQDERVVASRVGFVAGGTGITPIYQVMRAIASDPDDPTCASLVFCNKTPADILLREELDGLAAQRPERIAVWHNVDVVEAGDEHAFAGSVGRVSVDVLRQHLPSLQAGQGDAQNSPPAMIFICGPPGLERAVRKMLTEQLGHAAERIADF